MSRGVLRVQDLYARSERRAGSACWHWLGAKCDGQPRIWTFDHDRGEKRVMTGPRAVWNIATGSGMGSDKAHMTCVNTECVNPKHVGRFADLAAIGASVARSGKRKGMHLAQRLSAARKGWAARGIVPMPPETIAAIGVAEGTNIAIGKQFGIAHQLVSRIRIAAREAAGVPA